MKNIITLILLLTSFSTLAKTPASHVEINQQRIYYEENSGRGRALISVEKQTVRDGYRDEKGFHETGKRQRSVAKLIPLDRQ